CLFYTSQRPPPGPTPLPLHDALPISTTCSSAIASGCSAHTSSTTAAMRRWGPRGAASTSRRSAVRKLRRIHQKGYPQNPPYKWRSEEHTSELQSLRHLVCRLLLEKKK